MAFEVIDGDEGDVLREGEGLGVGDADEQGTGEAGAGGDGDGVEVGEGDVGLGEGGADDGDDGAEMLAAGEFGDDSAVAGVGGDLGGDSRGESAGAALDDGSGGLVAGGFDGEDQAVAGHISSLAGGLERFGVAGAGHVCRTRIETEYVAGDAPIRSGFGDCGEAAGSGVSGLSCRGVCAGSAAGAGADDYDVATSATPDVVLGMFERTFAVGAHFGVVLVADGDEAGDGRRRWRRSGRMGLIRMGGIRMRCGIRRAPRRM